jgi:nanoRNase/pAp phosphatase (c-di-AMP/oligoRNAs hydrolase)
VSILNEYSIHKQLNILIELLANSDIPKTANFTAMAEFLNSAKANHQEQIQAYSSNPNAYTFISEAEENEILTKKQNFE